MLGELSEARLAIATVHKLDRRLKQTNDQGDMTVQSTDPRPLEQWTAEDEIDLRQYLDVLIRWWREIVVITGLVVLLAILAILAMRLLLPLQFIASADVAIVRTTSDVNFDDRFRTTDQSLSPETGSLSARRSALLGLATTGAIARQVIGDLETLLDENEQIPASLLQMVEAEAVVQAGSRAESDLIRIIVTADDPEKAAAIANSWARHYVHEVNSIYAQVPNEVLASIEAELAETQESYLAAQTNLENFVADNQIDELNALVSVLQQQISQEVSLQQSLLSQWQRTQEQLNTAQALRNQIEAGGAGAVQSNQVALQILKISVYGMAPGQLQVEMRSYDELTADEMLADVTGLVTALENEIANLEAEFATGSTELQAIGESGQPLQAVVEQLRSTKAALEAEQARQRQLSQQRDLTWETYRTLSNKVAELNLTRAAATSEVRFGAEAVPPAKPTRRVSLVIGVLAAGTVGFFMAVILVSLLSFLGLSPLLTRKPATQAP